ncbi:MAG TPA: hypothetical protein PLM53_16360 [Spirochaetota bacterium]|nr:hypothetical protein [Spirochaetota bacterium]HPC42260.1 hypothetical protein [Spirochaetota bacterium]HPL17788.1 hypothetical protein [Spirochaetota bacterium]HQF09965.1 hypothetical protein [Spirochaetota bacterium]HQH98670.1 hypothetical protein [Spirochaetota bacterium]
MQGKDLLESIAGLRHEWRQARDEKLTRKKDILAGGHDMAAVRRDRLYRDLRKRQHGYAVRIIHLERTMNRKRAREKK